MVDAWTFSGEPNAGGRAPGTTTLLGGTTFCISDDAGDVEPGGGLGLFIADTRFLSTWRLRLNGQAVGPLSVVTHSPAGASFVSRLRPSVALANPAVLVVRERVVGEGMSERLRIENLGRAPVALRVSLDVATDFAHLFEVKEDRVRAHGVHSVELEEDEMVFSLLDGSHERRLSVSVPAGATVGPGRMAYLVELDAREAFEREFRFEIEVDGVSLVARGLGHEHVADAYLAWRSTLPSFDSSSEETFGIALKRSEDDLGALRIFDRDLDEDAVIAAGAPWYMAMFGRDSLITSEMSLLLDPEMALGTLRALARRQGRRVDAATEEEPGRILHEMRFQLDGVAGGPGRSAYYGSIDATPLFVLLLGEAARFGLPEEEIRTLLPAADRALAWVDAFGDRDGDGFVEYARTSTDGLVNQGWKDSTDGINFADGTVAKAPIALCEVQGYVYAAFLARAGLAARFGDEASAERCRARASALRRSFNAAYWMPQSGCFAVALDGDKRQVDSVTSNIGHLLWTGIVDEAHAAAVAAKLVSPELFSGWGVRTLSSAMGAYNPMSYHNGSVWPHDTAIAVAGLARYGFSDEAATVGLGLLDAAAALGGRLPELFCGFSREEFTTPVAYPAACAPQAWASAALVSLARSFLGLEPDLSVSCLSLRPAVPAALGRLAVRHLALGPDRIEVEAEGSSAVVRGLSDGVELLGANRV